MSRIQEILNTARETLGDVRKTRYSDATLISFLNIGIKDFAKATKSYKKSIYMPLHSDVSTYDFRPYCYEIMRVEYNNRKVDSVTTEVLDSINVDWRLETGNEVQSIIYDKLPRGVLAIYPRLESVPSAVTYTSDYGIVTDINVAMVEIFEIPTMEEIETNISNYLRVIAICKPEDIALDTTDIDLNTILDSSHDLAMVYFISGWCLRNDNDAGNRAFGQEQTNLYNQYLHTNRVEESFSSNIAVVRTTPYNNGFL